MNLYDNFAHIYKDKYLEYSNNIANYFSFFVKNFTDNSDYILDLACGEGTFCREMKKQGYNIEGVDLSKKQIEIAKKKSIEENLNINYINEDIIKFRKDKNYDIITCWFDSLNYIIKKDNLKTVFGNAFFSLKNNGIFIFDMNTIHGLINVWNDLPFYLFENSEDLFEVHEADYDYENNLAYMKIIFFIKSNKNYWKKFEEEHIEKGYKKAEIKELLTSVGFKNIKIFSSINPLLPDVENSNRIYIVAEK